MIVLNDAFSPWLPVPVNALGIRVHLNCLLQSVRGSHARAHVGHTSAPRICEPPFGTQARLGWNHLEILSDMGNQAKLQTYRDNRDRAVDMVDPAVVMHVMLAIG